MEYRNENHNLIIWLLYDPKNDKYFMIYTDFVIKANINKVKEHKYDVKKNLYFLIRDYKILNFITIKKNHNEKNSKVYEYAKLTIYLSKTIYDLQADENEKNKSLVSKKDEIPQIKNCAKIGKNKKYILDLVEDGKKQINNVVSNYFFR